METPTAESLAWLKFLTSRGPSDTLSEEDKLRTTNAAFSLQCVPWGPQLNQGEGSPSIWYSTLAAPADQNFAKTSSNVRNNSFLSCEHLLTCFLIPYWVLHCLSQEKLSGTHWSFQNWKSNIDFHFQLEARTRLELRGNNVVTRATVVHAHATKQHPQFVQSQLYNKSY